MMKNKKELQKKLEKRLKTNLQIIDVDKVTENIKPPTFQLDSNSWFVPYGEDNKLPEKLLEYYTNVGINRSIIRKKLNLFLGDGLFHEESDSYSSSRTIKFLKNVNEEEGFQDFMEKAALDYFIFGGFYIQIIKKGNNMKMYHMPFDKMRSGLANRYNKIKKYYYNPQIDKYKTWNKHTSEEDVIEFRAFDKKNKTATPQILFIKSYEPSNIYYPLPDYYGGIVNINSLYLIDIFHNTNLTNNFNPGMLITYSSPFISEEQQDEIVEQFQDKYGGVENTGKPILLFKSNEDEFDIKPLDVGEIDKMFEKLSEDVKENVVISHQANKAIISVGQAGQLGTTKEIINGTELFKNSYIYPIQNFILGKMNSLLELINLDSITIINKPVSLLKYELDELGLYLTDEEMRDYLGYKTNVNDKKVDEDVESNDIIDDKAQKSLMSFLKKIIKR